MQELIGSNESDKIPTWFSQRLIDFYSLYPSATMQPAVMLAWWKHLRDLSQEAITVAITRAPSTSSSFVPSAQTVREIALALPKSAPAAQTRPMPALPAPVKLGADNPFLYLAQKWEFESLELGLDPEKPSPKHIAKRRMQELLDLLADHGPRDMPEIEPAKITNRRTA